jgi:ferredoxin-NADP reductase
MDDAPIQNTYPLRVKKIIAETHDTKSFILETTGGQPIPYIPGQFLTFVFAKTNGKQERRNYSLSSIPGQETMITVKRIPNGEYSRYLFERVKEGDELTTIGASGFFTLPENTLAHQQYIFFAAGSGITPVFALINALLADHTEAHILLVYSNGSVRNAIFYDQLLLLQQQHAQRFHIEFLFSDATHVAHKRLGIYVLEKILANYVLKPFNRQLFYLCGPFEYMRMVTIILKNNGVPGAQIRKETFTIEVPSHKPQPPDKVAHQITATVQQKEYHFESRYPHTILQSAKAMKVPIPYSCEAGQCGTCAATCISGKVWMWRNDVLLDEEISKGRVLTCTGYAIGGDVVIVV